VGGVRVELLFWDGCPSHPRALADLRAALAAAGLPGDVELVEVRDADDAARLGFPGSPTIRLDGADVVPSDEPPALACRLYRRRDGRPSPTPDPEDLADALRLHAA
jgi:hypothetical protein